MQQRSATLKLTKPELIAFASGALMDDYSISPCPRRKVYSNEIEMSGFFHFHDRKLRRNHITVGFFVEDSTARVLLDDNLYDAKNRFYNYLKHCDDNSIFNLYSFFYFNFEEDHRHIFTTAGENIEPIIHPLSSISTKIQTLMDLTLKAFEISEQYVAIGLSPKTPFLTPSKDFSENINHARRFFDTIVKKTREKLMGAEMLAILAGQLPDAQKIINLINVTEANSNTYITNERERIEVMLQIKSIDSYLRAIKLRNDIYHILRTDVELAEISSLIATSDFPSKHDSFPGLSRQK